MGTDFLLYMVKSQEIVSTDKGRQTALYVCVYKFFNLMFEVIKVSDGRAKKMKMSIKRREYEWAKLYLLQLTIRDNCVELLKKTVVTEYIIQSNRAHQQEI